MSTTSTTKSIIAGAVILGSTGTYAYANQSNSAQAVTGASTQQVQTEPNYLTVKYRETQVDVDAPNFEYLVTSKSSFVEGAWYDTSNEYMIINLAGTNYQYCGMPSSVWQDFATADSFGSFYNSKIKGSYDCRVKTAPKY